jgi:CRP-like cAMP-binding protein
VDGESLRSVPALAGLSDAERAQVASHGDVLEVQPGALLCAEGEFGYSFFIVDEGKASVSIDGEEFGELAAGDVFGEIGLLVTGRRTATVTATTPMRLLALFDQDFRRLVAEMPVFEQQLRTLMASRFGAEAASQPSGLASHPS